MWALMSQASCFVSVTARSTTDEAADATADSDDSSTFVCGYDLSTEAPGCDFDCFVTVKTLGA